MKIHHPIAVASVMFIGMLFVVGGVSCPPNGEPADPDPDPDPEPPVTIPETEPNDELADLSGNVLSQGDHVRIAGSIADADDIDLYDLGPMAAGDRIVARINADNNELDPTLVIFDIDDELVSGNLFFTGDVEPSGASLNPHIEETFRHEADRYVLGISASYATLLSSGAYTVDIRVERGGTIAAPRTQHVLVNFAGGMETSRNGTNFAIEPFDPSAIDVSYAGMNAMIRARCMEVLRENFADYHVRISSSADPLPPAPYSVVHIGQVANTQELAGAEGLGIAIDGVDDYNADPEDVAVIFVNNFTGATFGLLQPLEPGDLAVALANVASHEIGHLLGLNHTFDPASLMNTLDSAGTLLMDQRFKRSLLFFGIFDPLNNVLHHNSDLLLRETVGGILRPADATISVGAQPLGATMGDVNGDGHLDVLVVNRSDRSVSVLTHDGSGQLAVTSTIALSAPPIDIRLLDLNGNGLLDAAVTLGATNEVVFLINDGLGTLVQAAESVTVPEAPFALAVADLDGDGIPDLAVVSLFANQVSVLTNHQNGIPELTHVLDVGMGPRNVSIADLDGDGFPDLLTTNTQDGTLSILYGSAGGGFEDAISLVAGSLPMGITTGDVNGDGAEDIVVTTALPNTLTVQFASNVTVFINRGQRSFAPGRDYFVGAFPQNVIAADLDDDGHLDLAVACGGDLFVATDQGQLSVLFNRGDGTFGQDVRYTAGMEPFGVLAGDLNGNNALDIVVVNTASEDVSVFMNRGDGTLGTVVDTAVTDQSKPIRSKLPKLEYRRYRPVLTLPEPEETGQSYCLTCRHRKAKKHGQP